MEGPGKAATIKKTVALFTTEPFRFIFFNYYFYLFYFIFFFFRKYINDDYIRHGGYNEVADLNDIIILYPQAIKTEVPVNPEGCWDWWGYTGVTYGK